MNPRRSTVKWLVAALFAVATASACVGAGASATGPDDVVGPVTWAEGVQATRLGRLWFSGQPDRSALERAKENGIVVVINLREPQETTVDERGTVELLDFAYYNVPIAGDAPFSASAFERIETLVAEHPDEQILLHCSSGNRAAAWLATHLVTRQKMPEEEAIATARKAGITKDEVVTKVKAYLVARTPEGGAKAAD